LFIKQARQVLHEYDVLMTVSQTAEPVQGMFRLGIMPTVSPYIVPLFLEKFSEANPQVRLVVTESKTEDVIAQIQEDQLDAGLLATPLNMGGIHEKKLFYEPFFVFVSPDSDLAKKTTISESDLAGESVWLLDEGHCFRNQVLSVCRNSDTRNALNNVSFSSGQLETMINLVRLGRGCTLLPYLATTYLTEDEKQSWIRPFAVPTPKREISLVYSRTDWKQGALQSLAYHIVSNLPANCYQDSENQPNIIPVLETD
jgi:LysR family hydrogen peroxide-inducible transcriptional activator